MWHGRQSSQLEIAEDSSSDGSCNPAEIIHGCERFELRIIHGRGRDWPMLIRRTPGASPTWTLPPPPPWPPPSWLFWHCSPTIFTLIITRGLILYCPRIIVPILLSDHCPFFVYFKSVTRRLPYHALPCPAYDFTMFVPFDHFDWLTQTHHVRQSLVNVTFCDKI